MTKSLMNGLQTFEQPERVLICIPLEIFCWNGSQNASVSMDANSTRSMITLMLTAWALISESTLNEPPIFAIDSCEPHISITASAVIKIQTFKIYCGEFDPPAPIARALN